MCLVIVVIINEISIIIGKVRNVGWCVVGEFGKNIVIMIFMVVIDMMIGSR